MLFLYNFVNKTPNTMLRTWIILLAFVFSVTAFADTRQLLDELDNAIAKRDQFFKEKEGRIEHLKDLVSHETEHRAILKTLDALYEEYYVFQFDSAMTYADRGIELATKYNDSHYTELFNIHKAEILAIGGLYVEAKEHLDRLDTLNIDQQMLFRYYITAFHIYSYWASYTHDTPYSTRYWGKAKEYLEQGMNYLDVDNPLYDYYKGEYYVYIKSDAMKARQHYQNVVSHGNPNSRVYAMACYALAGNYLNTDHDQKQYEQYLIMAVLADLRCCTMETVAMKILATILFEKGLDDMERAETYINISMEDAKFYNNRLRILEISRTLTQIMNTYQVMIEKQNRRLRYSVLFISLLLVALFVTAYYIYRQNRKLHSRRQELAVSNNQLTSLNGQLSESNERQAQLNAQLHKLNEKLVDTNRLREGLASIYIDLCAKYIDKLNKYQTLVKRKIKANQAQELLQTFSSTRISEEDAATFLTRFDKAFLELYPTFVDEFNGLLKPEGRIEQKSPNTFNTELRTYALIRLGVRKTTEIADLLFLSTQTIYNCRSLVRDRAISKETFEEDVMKLCTVIN